MTSDTDFATLMARMERKSISSSPALKHHKYHAQKVVIDGITFASKWEGEVYVALQWEYKAGLITEPLLQVPFALGRHFGNERVYKADFVFIRMNREFPQLVVVDAKGFKTEMYKQKKRTFAEVYGFCITEMTRK